jgi:hypothetical protein
MSKLTAKRALELLSAIPNEDFLTEKFTDGIGKCCAIGHLVRLNSENPKDYGMFNTCDTFFGTVGNEAVNKFARTKVATFLKEKHGITESNIDFASVNNFDSVNGYTQDNPKDRVIAMLTDMVDYEKEEK